MGLIREPRDVDFYIQSKPWTEKELKEISEIIKKSKAATGKRAKKNCKAKGAKTRSCVSYFSLYPKIKKTMGLMKEPIDVDFSMRSKLMTEVEHKELSEHMKKRKAAYLASEKRRAKRKAAKPGLFGR